MKPNKGFTLIELLVVIAIIGILSAVVLAALNDARGRASDSAIKAQLSNIRAEAEMFYDRDASRGYEGLCTHDPFEKLYIASINNARWSVNTPLVNGANYACNANSLGYAVAVKLLNNTDGDVSWCVDGTGTAKQIDGDANAAMAGSDTTPWLCN